MTTLPTTSNVIKPHSFGASLDDLLLRLAPAPSRPLITELAPQQAPRFSTESNPEDVMPEFGDVHSTTSWVGGEGLFDRWRHRASETDATRFWKSEHIDISPTDEDTPEELRLLTTTAVIDSLAATTVRTAAAGTTLWATSGQTLRKTADATAATPVFAADDPHAGEVATDVGDIATLGEVPYAALGTNGIHRYVSGAWAHWSDVAAVRVWGALDRIIASTGTALHEAAAGATSVLLYTLPDGESWTDVSTAGNTIVACATNGYVYAFALNDAGDLVITGQSELESEQPVAIRARGDVVFVATHDGSVARLWTATGPELNGLQLLREWEGGQVDRMSMGRDRLLIGLLNADGEGWVWRVELATTGISKAHRLGDGAVHGLLTINGTLYAGVAGLGVYRETSTLQTSGWLIGPMADFFRAEEKSWMTAWIDATIDLGQTVSLYYTTDRAAMNDPDHASWNRVRTYKASTSGDERTLGGRVEARALALMVRLETSVATSPKVRAAAVRSYPGPGDVLVQLPVDVGDQIERHGRRRQIVHGWGELMMDALREYEGKGVRVHLFRTGETVRGVVENISTPQPAATRRGSSTVVSMVTVRGRRVDEDHLIDIADGGAWGNVQWGGMSWGGEVLAEA